MKTFWKQAAVIAAALALSICLIVGLSVNTLAASTSHQQVGTNHCVEISSYPSNPYSGMTNPDGSPYTYPTSGITNPDGSPYTDPAGGLTNPDGSPYTYPTSGLTNPDGSPYEEDFTDEVYPGTLELYCDLVIRQYGSDKPVGEYGMEQKVPGFSVNFYKTVSDLEPSNKLYYATVYIGSCIYPADPKTEGETVSFMVLKKGDVKFSCYSLSGSLTVSGDGIDTTITQPSIPAETVTYPPTYPYTTVPYSQRVTYPSEENSVWTSSPDVTTVPAPYTTAPQTTEARIEIPVYCGDANGDGLISIDDVTLVQLYSAEVSTAIYFDCGDVNGDGEINIIDATCIQRYIADFTEDIGFAGEQIGVRYV